jgi:hypothetical protein
VNLSDASVADVVAGDVGSIELLQQGWRTLGALCADSAGVVEQTASPTWKGPAADAFGQRLAGVPTSLRETSELLAGAIAVLSEWIEHLATAKAEAQAAIDSYAKGHVQHRWWIENHAAIEEATGMPLPDPGLDLMASSERRADQVRDGLDSAATDVSNRLNVIADAGFSRFSALEGLAHTAGAFLAGAGEATWSLLGQLSLLSPMRWAFDFEGASEQVANMRDGVEAGAKLFVDDTETFVKQGLAQAVDVDGLVNDPARWAGHLVPDLVAWAAGAGAVRRSTSLLDDLVPEVSGPVVSYVPASRSLIEDVLDELPPGRNPWVAVVETEDDIWAHSLTFSQGGDPIAGTTYKGPFVRLPDGTTVGFRPTSSSGGATIDLTWSDGSRRRVHVE